MVKLIYGVILATIAGITPVGNTPQAHVDTFLPENDMYIGTNSFMASGMSETTFNQVINSVEQVYAPIVSQKGARLIIRRLWSDGTVNAQAYQQGSNWYVDMFGGLARHPVVTEDALALVVCHEIGHHIGGAPKMSEASGRWASIEGQSDYFSTLKCLRKVWKGANNQEIVIRAGLDPIAEKSCKENFGETAQAYLCMRSSMAGLSAAKLFANGSNPRFDTPDPKQVSRTYESHPAAQCRLDTYYQAALCSTSEDTDVSQSNPTIGACNDRKAAGVRPRCWYADSGGGGGGGGENSPTPTLNGQTTYSTSNPNEVIYFNFNVASVKGAVNTYIEISLPNENFPNPNGSSPSPRYLWAGGARGVQGQIPLIPGRLPRRGVYQFRVVAIDFNNQFVGNLSNSAVLNFN